MKLFKISQNVNNNYDTYDSAIVCAENEEEARRIHPRKDWGFEWDNQKEFFKRDGQIYDENDADEIDFLKHDSVSYGWVSHIKEVKVFCIGEAYHSIQKGVILASFNAG